jgi:hypothetical protein
MHHRLVPVAAIAAALLAPAAGHAAPVTVHLRVEGPTKTVFDGSVRTDVRPFHFTAGADRSPHECDGTAATGGSSPVPVAVRNGALLAAAVKAHFALAGTWSTFGATFTRVGDQRVAFNAATKRFLAEYKNGHLSQLGGCSDPIRNGDDVVYAYGTGAEKLLRLSGPARVMRGRSFTVRVLAGGKPVRGARVGGRPTGSDGRVTLGPLRRTTAFKATKTGAIRSNALVVRLR